MFFQNFSQLMLVLLASVRSGPAAVAGAALSVPDDADITTCKNTFNH